jgi:hypothetical protein
MIQRRRVESSRVSVFVDGRRLNVKHAPVTQVTLERLKPCIPPGREKGAALSGRGVMTQTRRWTTSTGQRQNNPEAYSRISSSSTSHLGIVQTKSPAHTPQPAQTMRYHPFHSPSTLLALLAASLAMSPTPAQATPRVLVYTATAGYRHDSIPTAIEVLGQQQAGWNVSFAFSE